MSGITVLSPVGINRVGTQPITPRLTSLDGITVGILNNNKPNSLPLQERVVEPAKFSYCIAENEAATPWEPFRVSRGFDRADSTVTVFSGEGPHNINDHVRTSAHTTLTVVADTMTTVGHNNAASVIRGDVLVAFGPEHAHTIASGGLSKRDVQQFLFERARNKVGSLKLRAMYKAENWPDWVDTTDDEALCPIVGTPDDIHIVVTGGPGKHSAFIPTFGTSKSVTRKIEGLAPRATP